MNNLYLSPKSMDYSDLIDYRNICLNNKNYLMAILVTYRIMDISATAYLNSIECFESWGKGIYADVRDDFINIAGGLLGIDRVGQDKPNFNEKVILIAMLSDYITPEEVLHVFTVSELRNRTWIMDGLLIPKEEETCRMIEIADSFINKINELKNKNVN